MTNAVTFTSQIFMMTYGLNRCAEEALEQPKIGTVLEKFRDDTDDIRSGMNRQTDAANA
jgi:hypothetical protein